MLKYAQIIVKNGSVVLFVFLQTLCLIWVIRYNQAQQKIYLHSYQLLATRIQKNVNHTLSYFNLKTRYDSLLSENVGLLETKLNHADILKRTPDTASLQHIFVNPFKVISATVINNSLDRRNNMITLDRGGKDGICPGMGVITPKGLVGIVTDTSHHFSLVISMLHGNTSISARLKRCGFFGPLTWEGRDPAIMKLQGIQKYADVRLGDTVVTSGYSVVFPKNLLMGTVSMYRITPGAFTYDIEVKLSQSMTNLEQVYVIANENKSEKLELEKKISRYE